MRSSSIAPNSDSLLEHARLLEFSEKIIANAPVAIFTINLDGVITTTNPAHLKIAGNPPPEHVLGLNWLHARSIREAGLQPHLRRGLEGEPFEVTDVSYTSITTGRHLYMTLRGVPLRGSDGRVEGLICIIEDTTEKTRYLKELERLRVYDEHILESLTNGIAVIDPGCAVSTVNTAMATLLGATKDEILGSDLSVRLHDLGAEPCAVAVEGVLRAGAPGVAGTLRMLRDDLSFSIRYKVEPLLDDEKQQYGAILLFEDISERERVNRKRLELEEQLRQATKMSALGEMAAGVAHEINNPLATIAACAEEAIDLMEERGEGSAEDLLETLGSLIGLIQEQSFRCKRITAEMLDFSRAGKSIPCAVDVNEVLRKAVRASGLKDEYVEAKIRLSLGKNAPRVSAESSQLQQVFQNLLTNAVDAVEDGGLISISTRRARGRVRIVFADTGVGMSAEQVQKAFHPFFTTKAPSRGTGLGLAICYRIVERFGGTIQVESGENRGTTFTLTFPVYRS
jgi:PAS domain S-box-containing protein